jgi:hypothetical protein
LFQKGLISITYIYTYIQMLAFDLALVMVWSALLLFALSVSLAQNFGIGALLGQRPEYIFIAALFALTKARLAKAFSLNYWIAGLLFLPFFLIIWQSVQAGGRATVTEVYIAASLLFVPAMLFYVLGQSCLPRFCKCRKRKKLGFLKKPNTEING